MCKGYHRALLVSVPGRFSWLAGYKREADSGSDHDWNGKTALAKAGATAFEKTLLQPHFTDGFKRECDGTISAILSANFKERTPAWRWFCALVSIPWSCGRGNSFLSLRATL